MFLEGLIINNNSFRFSRVHDCTYLSRVCMKGTERGWKVEFEMYVWFGIYVYINSSFKSTYVAICIYVFQLLFRFEKEKFHEFL